MFLSLTRKDIIERLSVIISYKECEQLLDFPKLSVRSGDQQAITVYNLMMKWDNQDSIVRVCCNTTTSKPDH